MSENLPLLLKFWREQRRAGRQPIAVFLLVSPQDICEFWSVNAGEIKERLHSKERDAGWYMMKIKPEWRS